MLALQNVLEMKSKQAKVAFLFTHVFSNTVHGLFSNSVQYFQFAPFVWTKNAMPKLDRTRVCFAILLYFLPKVRWSSSARKTKTSNGFIWTFFVVSFWNFCTFHDAWAHTASISIFPTSVCLIKLVGVGVQTSNSYLHK